MTITTIFLSWDQIVKYARVAPWYVKDCQCTDFSICSRAISVDLSPCFYVVMLADKIYLAQGYVDVEGISEVRFPSSEGYQFDFCWVEVETLTEVVKGGVVMLDISFCSLSDKGVERVEGWMGS